MAICGTGFKDDNLLLENLRAGQSAAFDEIYQKYWQQIFASVFKRLQHREQSKDVTQEIFLQLWLKRQEQVIENLPAYLFTAARNRVLTLMKQESRFVPLPDLILKWRTVSEGADAREQLCVPFNRSLPAGGRGDCFIQWRSESG